MQQSQGCLVGVLNRSSTAAGVIALWGQAQSCTIAKIFVVVLGIYLKLLAPTHDAASHCSLSHPYPNNAQGMRIPEMLLLEFSIPF
jgi:hypothetical protein